jgi:DMSO/TMAO reductase YedYZ molybdopterin-dependent catalytic subunit
VLIGLTGCSPAGTTDNITRLQSVEVRQYKGKNLSSIGDFRENSIKGPQTVPQATYHLVIDGLVEKRQSYTYDDVVKKHQAVSKVVQIDCVVGWNVTILWVGVLVNDLLREAGPKSDAKVVIFRAHDGYSTSFPIEYFQQHQIVLAAKMNGVVMPAERGFPFMLVAEEKWGYKWIKWVESITLSNDVSYRGYWESRGYSNTGDLNKDYFSN